ncbi:hypothetical protein [Granulicella sibirica]|nr:hypothetical protein [Granulicella sibirica]
MRTMLISSRTTTTTVSTAFAFLIAVLLSSAHLVAQQPPGMAESLANLADQPATRASFTFDRSMMQIAESIMDQNGVDGHRLTAALNSVTVDTYRYKHPAFYTPEVMTSIIHNYNAAGWKHLVNANGDPAASAQPHASITDLWLHFRGAEIDDVTVLLRAPTNMNVIEVSGLLRPLDLVHLSGHFGIPKVDPSAVMVAAPPGK